MKIMLTGNKNWGLAKELYKSFEHVSCFSRSTGVHLTTEVDQEFLAKKTLSCDVFINCSKLNNFNQTLLLKKVWDTWNENNKKGIIINIGSTVDTGLKGGSRIYNVEKVALRNLSRKLSLDTSSGNGIKVSYISLGYLDTKGVSFQDKVKIKLNEVSDIIQWVLNTPSTININEISIDAIQKLEEK